MVTIGFHGNWTGTYDELIEKKQTDSEFNQRLRFVFSKAIDETEPTCPICLENYLENKMVILQSCDHMLHLSCLTAWQRQMSEVSICILCKKEKDEKVLFKYKEETYPVSSKMFQSFFSDFSLNIGALVSLQKKLEGTALEDFNNFIISIVHVLKNHQRVSEALDSKEEIRAMAYSCLKDIEASFFKLEAEVKKRFLEAFLIGLNPVLFHDDLFFESQLEITKDAYRDSPKSRKEYFIGVFLEACYSRLYLLKKQKSSDCLYFTKIFYNKAFDFHYQQLIRKDSDHRFNYMNKMPNIFFIEFQKRLKKTDLGAKEIVSTIRWVQILKVGAWLQSLGVLILLGFLIFSLAPQYPFSNRKGYLH